MTEQTSPPSSDQPREHGVVVLLVDDQAMVGEAVRRMLLSETDIAFHYCQDPKEALARAAELAPTVILQDLIMPDIDGLDLVRDYRRQSATADTPLIVLSTREEAVTKAEAFARGANDYLVKLPDPVELIARIRYHSRGYIALLERNEAHAALARSEQALRDELSKAATYVQSLLPPPTVEPLRTDWRFIPCESLGGDVFDYQWLDDDHMAMTLLDVCGHGVGPALLSVSVLNLLRSRTLPDTDFRNPTEVLTGLNAAFQMSQHKGMFFTMWYGVYCRSDHRLTYAGAGHPPALLVRSGGAAAPDMEELASEGTMIGVTPEPDFPADTCTIGADDRLYVYSDGVFEIARPDGKMWGFRDFLSFMSEPATGTESKIDQLLAQAHGLRGEQSLLDDFSMLQVTF
jgi:sigma-B regulation protein RsbU (phosphoserine phosphatase)